MTELLFCGLLYLVIEIFGIAPMAEKRYPSTMAMLVLSGGD